MKKFLLVITIGLYLIIMFGLLRIVYDYLEDYHFSSFNFFIAGALVILVSILWGYVLFLLFINPKKQMEDRLSFLIKNIVHELNIPLSTIKANSTMLQKNLNDTKALKRLNRIDRASDRLKRLYDELFYHINKEIEPISSETFDLKELLIEHIEIFEESTKQIFILEVPTQNIKADKIGFEQMIDNVITNAIKYSDISTPITIKLENNILSIQDKGIGIKSREIERIYERYYQVDTKREGKGIGISIIKEYCQKENILLTIDSTPKVGTTINLDLTTLIQN